MFVVISDAILDARAAPIQSRATAFEWNAESDVHASH